ncbi:MAG: hypothetical protein ACJ8HI_05505 [Massilia sp.]
MSTQNEQRDLQQAPIPTHPPDPAARGEADKVVGEASPHFKDYNDPPPDGGGKSTGQAMDAGVGGALGEPPAEARDASDIAPTGDNGIITEAQSGADQIAEEARGIPPAQK